MTCCVPEGTLPPRSLCQCGSWDVTMIWMHGLTDAHKCNNCGRVWNQEYGIEMGPTDLNWAHLPAVGAARYRQERVGQRDRS